MPVHYISAFKHVCWWFYLNVMRGMQQTRSLNESYVQSTSAAGHTSVKSQVAVHAAVSTSLVRPDFLNSEVMSQVRRQKTFHNDLVPAVPEDASV